jgi:hypothetical protein
MALGVVRYTVWQNPGPGDYRVVYNGQRPKAYGKTHPKSLADSVAAIEWQRRRQQGPLGESGPQILGPYYFSSE